jgi:glycosyltransferase involved in cell wall biosynthesis
VIEFAMKDERNAPSEYAAYFSRPRSYEQGAERPGLQRLTDAASTVYSWSARKALGRLLDRERPDVAHLHNVYHQLTLSVVDELSARGIPIVQTLHDWKIACPAYTLFTEGAPCRRCLDSNVLNAVRHRCVKGSRAASALAALEAALAHRRGTYMRIHRFVAPSDFAGAVARASGVPSNRICRLAYFLPDEELRDPGSPHPREPVFFLGGRLDPTKGVRQLLAAFERVREPARLRIAGWGPLEPEVRSAAERTDSIEFLGALPRHRVLEELGRCRALLLPSVWEDNCPLILLEAQARCTAAIVSDRGGPPEFVREGMDGFVVSPNDPHALAERIDRLAGDAVLAARFGRSGHSRLLGAHDARRHYERLVAVYDEAAAAAVAVPGVRRGFEQAPVARDPGQ